MPRKPIRADPIIGVTDLIDLIQVINPKKRKSIALLSLGGAISKFHTSNSQNPFEDESKKREGIDPSSLPLLKGIKEATEVIRKYILTDPEYEPLRSILNNGGIDVSNNKNNTNKSDKNDNNDNNDIPDKPDKPKPLLNSYIFAIALVCWGNLISKDEQLTINEYRTILATLLSSVNSVNLVNVDFETPNGKSDISDKSDPIGGTLWARMVFAKVLEHRIFILNEQYLRLPLSLCRWLAGHELCVPNLGENHLKTFYWNKKNKQTTATESATPHISSTHTISPHELYMKLKGYVMGNDTACKQLAVRGSLHLSRRELLRSNQEAGSNECLLIMGESGTGKTYMVETFGKLCGLPFASMSASSFTASGYVGLDPDDALKTLVRNAGDPKNSATLEKARYGVLFLDEWDKRRSHSETGLDVSGSQIQYEFLRMLSGTKLILGAKRNEREENPIEFNSNGTLFCFAGAFTGLDTILKQMAKDRSGIGFGGEGYLKKTPRTYDALLEFGMVSEFLNRITAIITMKSPDRNDLVRIATSPHGDIQTYNRILAKQGMNITIDASGVLEMAGFCVETKLYARGIRLIVSALVEETVFNRITGAVSFGVNEVKGAIARTVGTV